MPTKTKKRIKPLTEEEKTEIFNMLKDAGRTNNEATEDITGASSLLLRACYRAGQADGAINGTFWK